MNKQQFNGLVDCLVNVCNFNTSKHYSLSLRRYESGDYFDGDVTVFTNYPKAFFSTIEIEQLLGLAKAWSVTLYFQTLHGVTVARYL